MSELLQPGGKHDARPCRMTPEILVVVFLVLLPSSIQ